MSKRKGLYFTPSVLAYPLGLVFSLWFVFWLEIKFNLNFTKYGILPHTIKGLRGVLFGPFIHSNFEHLFNNSVPLFVLTTTLFYFYRNIKWKILGLGLLLTGILTWFLGRPAIHIGASGLVYMLMSFLFFRGLVSRKYQLMAISFVVIFLYGSMIWYLFPVDPKISWEGHLSGFLVGIAFAFIFKETTIAKQKYSWEQEGYNPDDDPFLRQFDENGNFFELPKQQLEDVQEGQEEQAIQKINIVYTIKKSKPEDPD